MDLNDNWNIDALSMLPSEFLNKIMAILPPQHALVGDCYRKKKIQQPIFLHWEVKVACDYHETNMCGAYGLVIWA
jgi:hypothetical protein